MSDTAILTRLVKRLDGHVTRTTRYPRTLHLRLHRDPVDIAHRYLRRFAGGQWHQGGHHVARLFGGPGIAIPIRWRNDRNCNPQPYLININQLSK